MPHQGSPRSCEHTTPRHPSVPNLLRGRQAGMTADTELDNSARGQPESQACLNGANTWEYISRWEELGNTYKKQGGSKILRLTRHLIRMGAQPSIPKVEELPHFA